MMVSELNPGFWIVRVWVASVVCENSNLGSECWKARVKRVGVQVTRDPCIISMHILGFY